MRQLVLENACYWLHEYHLDGLRLDATHAIYDDTEPHILRELAERARVAVDRPVVIIAEDGRNQPSLINDVRAAGAGLDAVWADDFHHQMRVFLTGERDGYYRDYEGRLADVGRTVKEGFFYQGQDSAYLGRPRGHPVANNPARQFVFALQNHDQVGNRALGARLHHQVADDVYRVASLVLLTVPETPLLFMGQEFATSSPFLYFTDHEPELGRLVTAGRREEFRSFASFRDPRVREQIPDPQDRSTSERSVLNFAEREQNRGIFRLYHDLIRLRREDPVLAAQSRERLAYAVPEETAIVFLQWLGSEHRLVIANFGERLRCRPADLFAGRHLAAADWRVVLQTRDQRYEGDGESPTLTEDDRRGICQVPARCGVILAGHGTEES